MEKGVPSGKMPRADRIETWPASSIAWSSVSCSKAERMQLPGLQRAAHGRLEKAILLLEMLGPEEQAFGPQHPVCIAHAATLCIEHPCPGR